VSGERAKDRETRGSIGLPQRRWSWPGHFYWRPF
jgi:hypothetical protein